MTPARRFLLILAALVALAVASCAKHEERSLAGCVDGDSAPVDPVLLAFLSRARSAHHLADQHEESGELAAAIGALDKMITGPVPGGSAPPPEVREVLADTHARLADLTSKSGQFDDAAGHVERGLELAREVTYFRGHLFEVRGLLEERRATQLAESGDTTEAAAAKKRALDAFEQSMEIQAEVIQKAVGTEDAR
jgi:hypothetical protein